MRNSAKLLSANVLSQIIAFLLLSFITRIYSVYDIGVLGLFLTVSGFLSLFAGAKYEFAILLENERKRAAAVFDLCFLLNLVFSLVVAMTLWVGDDWFFSLLGYEALLPYSQMIPLLVFLSSLGLSLTYWFNYNKQFTRTATYNFVQVVSNNLMKLGFGILSAGSLSLILANQMSYVLALAASAFRKGKKELFHFPWVLMKELSGMHRKFPKYYLPHTVVNYFSANLVVLLLSGPFGLDKIGVFTVAIMLGLRPVTLISSSLEQVLSQNIAQKVSNREPIQTVIRKLSLRTLGLSLLGLIFVYLLLPWVVGWFLDERWSSVTLYLRILLPFFLLTLLCGPISSIPSIVGSQGRALMIEIGMLVMRVLVLLAGVWVGSFEVAIALFSGVSALMLIGQYYWYSSLISRYERSL